MMVDDIKITAMEMISILQCLFNLDFLISLKKVNCVSNLMFLETLGGSCDNGNARISWWQATQSRWQFWSGSAFAGNNSRLRAKLITRYFQITGPHMKGDIKIMAIYICALYQGNADVYFTPLVLCWFIILMIFISLIGVLRSSVEDRQYPSELLRKRDTFV